jgi:hypothetical protein
VTDDASRVHRSPAVLSRTVGDHVLLASLDRPNVDELSGSAAVVWELLATPLTTAELMDELAALYDASTEVLARDVGELLRDLERRGWVGRGDVDG